MKKLGSLLMLLTMAIACSAVEFTQNNETCKITSQYYDAEISLNGARIESLYDKVLRREVVWTGGKGQMGGLLDDKFDFTLHPFSIQKETSSDPKVLMIKFTAQNQKKIGLSKTLTFSDESPVIAVKYEYSNPTQADYVPWVRNFALPGGMSVEKNEKYFFLSTEKGWQNLYAENYYPKRSSNWVAILNEKVKQGFVFCVDSDMLDQFYFWENVTLEWFNVPIPPGKSIIGECYIALLQGMTEITGFDPKIAFAFLPSPASDHSVVFQGTALNLANRRVEAKFSGQVHLPNGELVQTVPEFLVKLPAYPNAVSIMPTTLNLEPGTYVFTGVGFVNNCKVSSSPIIFKVGQGESDDTVQVQKAQPAFSSIPGWISQESKLAKTNEEIKQGFWLSRGYEESKVKLADAPIELHVGLSEGEAVNFSLNAIQDFKRAPISIQESKELSGHFQYYLEENAKFEPLGPVDIAAGQSKEVWVLFDSRGLKPGLYKSECILSFSDFDAVIPIAVRVWPVHLPDKRYMHLMGYVPATYFSGGMDIDESIRPQIQSKVRTFAQMGGSLINWYVPDWSVLNRIKVNGTKLTETVQSGKIDLNNLPDLDFSYYNILLDEFVRNGIKRFELQIEFQLHFAIIDLLNKSPGIRIEPQSHQWEKVVVWYLSELQKYTQSRGCNEFFIKISDEFSTERIPEYNRIAQIVRDAGYRPFTTVTGAITQDARAIRDINPYLDQWQMSYPCKDDLLSRFNDLYRLKSKQSVIKTGFSPFLDKGAKHTWSVNVFGKVVPDLCTEVEDIIILQDGIPLQRSMGSPAGNTEFNRFWMLASTLYIATDGSDIKNHNYVIEYTVRQADPEGRILSQYDANDELWFYGGYTEPDKIGYEKGRAHGWLASMFGFTGFGFWTYHWFDDTPCKIIWYNAATNTTQVGPAYWGLKDGWEDAQYMGALFEGMSVAQKKSIMTKLIGFGDDSALTCSYFYDQGFRYSDISNMSIPGSYEKAKAIVLECLSERAQTFEK